MNHAIVSNLSIAWQSFIETKPWQDLNGTERLSIIGFFYPHSMLTFNQNIDILGRMIIVNQLVPLESFKKFRL